MQSFHWMILVKVNFFLLNFYSDALDSWMDTPDNTISSNAMASFYIDFCYSLSIKTARTGQRPVINTMQQSSVTFK